jgi:hypothetical protein
MVLAGKLNKSLTVKGTRSAHVADFQARYAHAGTKLALPVASDIAGDAGD